MSNKIEIDIRDMAAIEDLVAYQAPLFDSIFVIACVINRDDVSAETIKTNLRTLCEDVRSLGEVLSRVKKLARQRLKELEG